MKVGLVQRVLAGYRVPFFDMLADALQGELQIFSGESRPNEMIDHSRIPVSAKVWPGKNLHLFSGKFYICLQLDILKWLKSWNPDILILEANRRYPFSIAAALWMRFRRRPVIGWGLGTGSTFDVSQRWFLRLFDALITYSSAGAEAYRAAGFSSDRIFIAKNAAASRPQGNMPQRAYTPNWEKSPILLYVGRLQERKRVDLLIRACSVLEESFHPILWIVGDGPVREQLVEISAECFPETVFWGALYNQSLKEKFDHADLFVLPGTGGLAIQQAMASGLPVIAAEADGTQNDLIRSDNGVLIRAGDLDHLVQTIRNLLSDPIRLRKMGEASFRIVHDEINLESMTGTFIEAIHSVMA